VIELVLIVFAFVAVLVFAGMFGAGARRPFDPSKEDLEDYTWTPDKAKGDK
jgi:hypothetical protein